MRKVFVLGLERFNLNILETLPDAEDIEFIELLSADEAVEVSPGFRFDDLLALANARLDSRGPPDAILNYWDFPGSCLAPLLCREHGLPGVDLAALAVFEHKYWARCLMREVVPEATPRFCAVDPYSNDPAAQIDLDYPYWLKPIISHSSYLGFRVADEEDLLDVLSTIRAKIAHFGDPFDEYLAHVDMPPEYRSIGGRHCIAEEIISHGHQATIEGYVWDGRARPLGSIDSTRDRRSGSSFSHYRYPSRLPAEVMQRAQEATATLLARAGYDNAPYNVEFYWDEDTDRIRLLEINTRISKSHCPLFLLVDGASHQKVALDLALGREPAFPSRQGVWPCAIKFMVRLFQDGEITRVPNATDLHMVHSRYPEAMIQILVASGQRLSHLAFQDSYSFEIADVFLGGRDEEEVRRKYADVMEMLPLEVHLTAPIPAE